MMSRKSKILIVDDERDVREVLARIIMTEGYICDTAGDVERALAMIDSSPFDLVITDIMMPGRTGVELLEEIKRREPDTAVIMVTAVSDTQTAIKAIRSGAYDYVCKPFNLAEVLMSVERALEKRALLISNREYQERLEQKVEEQTSQIRETFLGAVKALAVALEEKDPYTNGHSIRVTEITVIMARELGLEHDVIENIRLGGLVHDIGKMGVPEEILLKAGKLADDEFELIKTHPSAGERILSPVIKDPMVLNIVRHHHERFSGGGYPAGLAEKQIPIGARLLAVADSFDAMTSTRPYREAIAPERARLQLMASRGDQFDPEIVDLFMAVEPKMPFCPVSARPRTGLTALECGKGP